MMNNDNNNPHGAIVYDYTDENGKLLYQKLRSDTKDFRFRQPTDGDGWLYHLDGVNPVLYNLPDVIKKDVIYIVEGEKDADNVKKELGLTATTPPFGAGKWDDSFNKYFDGKDIYIIPDNDDVGRNHAEMIAEQIMHDAVVVKIIDLTMEYPQLQEKGDISDLISAVGADEAKAMLKRIIENTKDYTITWTPKQKWVEIKPFEEFDTPPFPLDCLPDLLQSYVKTISDNLATPVEMAVLVALAMVAVCLQGRVFVQAKEDYVESTNLYVLVIADPGERKSPLLKLMVKPLYEHEKLVNQQRRKQIHEEEAVIASKEEALKEAQDSGDFEKIISLQIEIDELKENQTQPLRYTSDDFTVEALTTLMAKNNGRMAVISSEGGMFDNVTGRYSSKNNFETLLKAYTGDTIRIDRKSREAELIENPFLTILLMAQESRLQGIMSNGNLRGQGLLGRFLYCQPDSPLGTRKYDTPALNHAVIEQFNSLIIKLLDLQDDYTLTLSEQAKDVCKKFFDWLEPQLISELYEVRDWASKLHGTTIRIAGILHCLGNSGVGDLVISERTMENACKLAMYFIEHAKKAFSLMGANEDIIKAKFVLRKLETAKVTEMSRREIFIMCRSRYFKKTEDIDDTLNLLTEHGYIRPKKQEAKNTAGRKASVVYEFNSVHFAHFAQ